MAFHELATSDTKYGALSYASDRVHIDWTINGHGNDVTLTIVWSKLGGPPVEASPRPGFGSRLLRQAITQELGWYLDIRFKREGVCCTITVPVGSAEWQAA